MVLFFKVVDSCWIFFRKKCSGTFRYLLYMERRKNLLKSSHNRAKNFTFLSWFDGKNMPFSNMEKSNSKY